MGLFLQCNDDSPVNNWTCSARAKLECISQSKSSLRKTYNIRHTFTSKENDWGYQAFLSYDELFNPDNGYVVNKKLHARVEVEADAPHGTDWDSKKYTGFVGLKNQGAQKQEMETTTHLTVPLHSYPNSLVLLMPQVILLVCLIFIVC